MFENKEEITLNEFKAWLVGLIRGKNGKLPDFEDWKLIKEMLDKIVPEQSVVTIKEDKDSDPFGPWKTDPYKYYPPYYVGDPPPGTPWITCSSESSNTLVSNDCSNSVESWEELFAGWTLPKEK